MTLLIRRATRIIVTLLIIIFSHSGAYAQNELPVVQMKQIDGQQISSAEVFGSEQPVLLVFWATWCNHTSIGLSDIQDDYLYDWQDEFNLKVVAVSVDDAKTSNRAISVANSKGWDFDVFLDENGDFRRAMGVNNAPHVFLINSKGQVVWQQPSYMAGDEELIQEKLEGLE